MLKYLFGIWTGQRSLCAFIKDTEGNVVGLFQKSRDAGLN